MISTDRQPADAMMPPLAECLRIRLAALASLRSATRIDPNQLPASVFSFAGEFGKEGRPSGIIASLLVSLKRGSLTAEVVASRTSL